MRRPPFGNVHAVLNDVLWKVLVGASVLTRMHASLSQYKGVGAFPHTPNVINRIMARTLPVLFASLIGLAAALSPSRVPRRWADGPFYELI